MVFHLFIYLLLLLFWDKKKHLQIKCAAHDLINKNKYKNKNKNMLLITQTHALFLLTKAQILGKGIQMVQWWWSFKFVLMNNDTSTTKGKWDSGHQVPKRMSLIAYKKMDGFHFLAQDLCYWQ